MPANSSRRGAVRVWALVLSLLVGVSAGAVVSAAPARADVDTVSNDNQRTGWDQNEPALSSGSVTGSDFGQLFSTALDGQIYAQPLVVGSTVIVGTEENYVYGLNSETGAILWSTYLGPSWPASTIGCGDLVPDIGITSTPVYDPSSGYVYLTAKVNNGTSASLPHYYLYALNAATGAVRPGWPVTIGGSPSNDPTNTFDTEDQLQRPGLLLQNGSIYLAFGGHCDYQPYRGYVVGVNIGTQVQHMWTTEAGANASGAGVWLSGGGIVSDGAGGMFIATGNGVTPPVGPGTSPPTTLSESVVHLAVAADGTISASDFFAPANAATLDANDQDVASGGPVALPDAEFGTTADPHLMVEIGKDGRLFLLNRDSLGGRAQGAGGTDAVVGETTLAGVWGHPAVWGGDGGYVYVDEAYSHLVALGYGLTGTGQPALHVAGNSAESFGYTSGSPVVTSNGTTSGSALVWVVQASGPNGSNGELMVYNAVPSNGVMTLLRSWPLGTVSKFSVPATNNGRIYVGTRDGNLIAFGAPTTQPLQGSGAAFGSVAVDSTSSANVTLTAARTVTVSAATTSAPFGVGATTTPALPVTLTAGQTLTVPVTYSPTAWGASTGTLSLTTDQGTVNFGLSGTGTQGGLAATPASQDWGSMAVGSSETLTVGVTNTGTTTETITGVTGPSAPFTASGLPAVGSTIAPGVSETMSVTYAPTAVENDSSSIVLTSDQGSVTIPLTGVGIQADPQVTINPTSLSFGNVAIGQVATQTFTVANTGNVNLTVTKAAPAAAPFGAVNPIPENQELAPGESYTVSVTFTPTALTSYSGVYEVSTNTGQGAMSITLTGTGVGSQYASTGPTRILDTRYGLGAPKAKVAVGSYVALKIAGNGSIPASVAAVALNVTATDTVGNGYVSVEPDGTGAATSNLNYLAGQTKANTVIAPVAADGKVDLYVVGSSGGSADLIADVSGYFAGGVGSGYTPVTPARILDTRHGTGAPAKQVAGNSGLSVGIAGADSIPSGVTAVALHVTVTDAAANGWIAAEPDGAGTPTTSILNYLKGQTVSNTVIVPVAADGKIELYNGGGSGAVDLIGDVAGYYSAASKGTYVPVTPYRAWDSRKSGTALVSNGTTTYALGATQTQLGIPSGATIAANITVADTTANGYVTAFAAGSALPGVSNLNYLTGQTVAGLSIVATSGAQQKLSVYNQSTGHGDVILDVFGYFTTG
ncbi:choice-of-anchor D domain-containing protein [Actinospica durhamensis]|uniref:Choice-of-anchor D domain-containing protein n=1 Tax=Actinospica durhamensis TaxID=1508375 RepID=A0A941IKU5_9ACTN|nr:choice-of-anchor D domain-containing protein [Actinospica durhamensis]MBR7832245.1 choice-of-anchor D domain-containing protein [Actinospica durhamensis]